MTDTSEVERLRARVAELEAEQGAHPGSTRRLRRSGWWGAASAVLLVLACVLAPLSVASVWASSVVSDTDRYVETVAPLVDDPAVQAALAAEVTTMVFEDLDVEGITTDALQALADQPNVPPRVAGLLPTLAVPLTDGVESFTRDQVDRFLATEEFAILWAEVNRIAHAQVVKVLEGDQGGVVSAQEDQITLNLAPIVAAVQERLVDRGFGLAGTIPAVDRTFVLAQSETISRAQGAFSLLDALGVWLPGIALALFATGVLLARDRRRALVKGALGVAAAMVALGVALVLLRISYVDTTPADVLTPEAAGQVFDTFVRFLRTSMRALGVAALAVALAAFLAGPSTAALRTRASFEHGIGSARGGAEHVGWNTGPLGTWVFGHRRALQVSILVGGGLTLTFWDRPTAWVVFWIAVAVVLLLALIQFLGTPPAETAAPAVGTDVGPEPALTIAMQSPPVPADGDTTTHAVSGRAIDR